MISNHIYLLYDPYHCKAILKEIEEKVNNQCTNFNEKLFFEFSFVGYNPPKKPIQIDWIIKECGVWPIYHLGSHGFLG